MAFPGSGSRGLQKSAPILVATTSSIAVPATAKFIHVYIVGGGGGGGCGSGAAGAAAGASGGGCGGAAYARVDVDEWQFMSELPNRSSRPSLLSFTIAAGATPIVRTIGSGGTTAGNEGGSTSFTLTGGFSLTVGGGKGGGGSGGVAGLIPNGELVAMSYPSVGPVLIRPLIGATNQHNGTSFYGDTSTSISGAGTDAAGGGYVSTVGSEVGSTGSTIPARTLIPWWLQMAGLTRGSGGAGAVSAGNGKAAGGGAGGFGGNGGAAAASNVAGAVTGGSGAGFGSGGGAAVGLPSNTLTGGAGAPGCAVVMFELEV